MKLKSLVFLLALSGLGSSCTSDDPGNEPAGLHTNELQLVFSGTNGENQEYTKAIASESENKIDKLDVYLFASDKVDGTYYFLEKWEEGTAYDPLAPATTKFLKQGSGTSWKASIYPNELKGLPYLKLLCVANNNVTGNITDDKFYDADGTEILTGASALKAIAAGDIAIAADSKVTVTGDATTEEAFRKVFTKQMQNVNAGVQDIIHTPLLMTGTGQTKISGSISKVNITLKRVVARFDIDNTSAKSQLTIEKVSLAQARKSGSLWGTALTDVSADRPGKLMTYAPVDYTGFTGANMGVTESVIYVYPGMETDESYLVIEGKYKSPVPGAGAVDVTYNIPIVKTDIATATSKYVSILANSRYQLRITDVTQSNIYATFEVVDWTSGGGIQIKPDNDAPMFDKEKNSATDFTAVTGNVPAPVGGTSKTAFVVENRSEFKMTVAATGKVRSEQSNMLTKAGATDWLTVTLLECKEIDGIYYSTFSAQVNAEDNKTPMQVSFINEAASYDPALWTTLTFYGQASAPVIEDGQAHSLGNTIDATAGTANMYNAVGSYLTIQTWCVDGSTMELPAGDNFEQVGTPVTDGFYTTYKVKIANKLTDGATADIKFKNGANESTLTVTAVATGMTAELDADATGIAELTGASTPYTVTTDIDQLGDKSYTLKINAPQDVTVSLPNGKWLKVAKAGFAAGVSTYTVTLNTATTDYADFDLVFTNKLDATDKLTVTMQKKVQVP